MFCIYKYYSFERASKQTISAGLVTLAPINNAHCVVYARNLISIYEFSGFLSGSAARPFSALRSIAPPAPPRGRYLH